MNARRFTAQRLSVFPIKKDSTLPSGRRLLRCEKPVRLGMSKSFRFAPTADLPLGQRHGEDSYYDGGTAGADGDAHAAVASAASSVLSGDYEN
jgi:hypothetical protein